MKLGVDVEKSKKEIKGVEKYGMKSLELRAQSWMDWNFGFCLTADYRLEKCQKVSTNERTRSLISVALRITDNKRHQKVWIKKLSQNWMDWNFSFCRTEGYRLQKA